MRIVLPVNCINAVLLRSGAGGEGNEHLPELHATAPSLLGKWVLTVELRAALARAASAQFPIVGRNDFLRESAHLRILSMYKFSLRHVDRGLMMWKYQTNEVLAIVSRGVDGRH
jgi:hypothetical protein